MGENNSSENKNEKEKKIYIYSPIMELYAKAEIPPNVPRNPIIKWYQTSMTYEEKYRFGHITYEEYCAWMYELMNEAQQNQNREQGPAQGQTQAQDRGENITFWHDDSAERTNISSNDYNDFLSQNNVDISNRSTVDFDKLASEVGAQNSAPAPAAEAAPPPAASEEVDVNDVLASVNKDMHGGDAILSQEEIEALFAAANG